MIRMMLSVLLALTLASSIPARNDPTMMEAATSLTIEATAQGKVESSRAIIIDGKLFYRENHLKTVTYTDEKDGVPVQVTKTVAYTMFRPQSADEARHELVAFDRQGKRIDASNLPKWLNQQRPVLILYLPHLDAELRKSLKIDPITLKSFNDECLILVLPASKLRDR